jgi:hypothetical protein
MRVVRHPHCRQLASPVQFGQRHRIAAVGLHSVTGPARDQRWRDHDAILAQSAQQTMHAITAGASLVTEVKPPARPSQLLDQAAQRLRRRRDLAMKAHFAAATSFSNRHRRAPLVDVQSHECAMLHIARLLSMRLGTRLPGATLDTCILETGASAQATNIRSKTAGTQQGKPKRDAADKEAAGSENQVERFTIKRQYSHSVARFY